MRVRYYPKTVNVPVPSEGGRILTERFRDELLFAGMSPRWADLFLQQMDELLRVNEGKKLDAWRDPRGLVKPIDPF